MFSHRLRQAKAAAEFGAKIVVSMVDGYMYADRLDWDSFNESVELKASNKELKKRFRYYPETMLANKIYQNRNSRTRCKEKAIRLRGAPLGRSPREGHTNKELEPAMGTEPAMET